MAVGSKFILLGPRHPPSQTHSSGQFQGGFFQGEAPAVGSGVGGRNWPFPVLQAMAGAGTGPEGWHSGLQQPGGGFCSVSGECSCIRSNQGTVAASVFGQEPLLSLLLCPPDSFFTNFLPHSLLCLKYGERLLLPCLDSE